MLELLTIKERMAHVPSSIKELIGSFIVGNCSVCERGGILQKCLECEQNVVGDCCWDAGDAICLQCRHCDEHYDCAYRYLAENCRTCDRMTCELNDGMCGDCRESSAEEDE